MPVVPIVVTPDERGFERAYDIYSMLMKKRIIFIGGPIDNETANIVIAQLLFLDMGEEGEERKPIDLYINSPGGIVTATLAIYDTIQHVKAEVHTFCIGLAASAAAVLLASGTSGKRYALPHSKVMIHQPWGTMYGHAADISIEARELLKTKELINKILAKHTGQPIEKIERDTDRNFYMSAEESKEYGIVDQILYHPEKE